MYPRLEQHRRPEMLPPIHDVVPLIGAHRFKFGETLKYRDSSLVRNLRKTLRSLNPDRAEKFLNEILKINPSLPDSLKTKGLEKILKSHSPHTLDHVFLARDLTNLLRSRKDIGILQSLRLDDLATAIEAHDFGKLAMRDSTLNTPHTQFNAQENREKEAHPLVGHTMLKLLKFNDLSQRIALTHHLRYATVDNELRIIGYPVDEFLKFCRHNNISPSLKPEDHLAAFIDVYSALTDVHRVSNLHGTNNPTLSEEERSLHALEVMDRSYFKDDYYQKGEGAPLFQAFKKAITEELYNRPIRLAA